MRAFSYVIFSKWFSSIIGNVCFGLSRSVTNISRVIFASLIEVSMQFKRYAPLQRIIPNSFLRSKSLLSHNTAPSHIVSSPICIVAGNTCGVPLRGRFLPLFDNLKPRNVHRRCFFLSF